MNKEIDRTGFWKEKKVLITGSNGFLGSWLAGSLIKKGAKVIGLDVEARRGPSILSTRELAKMRTFRMSVTDYPSMLRIIRDNRIEYVFHLAAKSIVNDCLRDPAEAFLVNVKGTWSILEACRNGGKIKVLIVASSDKAYGLQTKLPYEEDQQLLGAHPYDASKACAELLAYSYYMTYGLPVGIIRCGNIYGPGDYNTSRLVPDAVRSAISDKTLFIRSDGKSTRDYVYIEDAVKGYLLLARNMHSGRLSGEAFNLGNESPVSVLELVRLIYRIAGKKPCYKILNHTRHEIRDQYLSTRKAVKMLGWKPSFRLEEGLETTIDWYRAHLS